MELGDCHQSAGHSRAATRVAGAAHHTGARTAVAGLHRAVFEAIRDGDGAQAGVLVRKHISATRASVDSEPAQQMFS
jgi:DNA-binding FadR family transcriptional regulator